MPRYCPNCSAELNALEVECWNCGALFGPNSSWIPTDSPIGAFRLQQKVTVSPRREASRPMKTETDQRPRLLLYSILLPAIWISVSLILSSVSADRRGGSV